MISVKDLLEKINISELLISLVLGVALIASIVVDQKEAAFAISAGLVGHLGTATAKK